MSNSSYFVGDQVVLRSGAFRKADNDRSCRVTSLLPQAFGVNQYRVQFEHENFERHVSADDIESSVSGSAGKVAGSASSTSNLSWINTNAIKIKR